MKIGLVLEGGAMRGMYTCGVLDTFMDNGLQVDGIVGVSAGALFGVNFLSQQKGRALRYNKRFNHDPKYLGLYPLLREGNIISTQYAYYDVPHHLDRFDDDMYKNAKIPFFAVLTNMATGKAEYLRVESVFDEMDKLRASGSMPFVSQPVVIDGQKYLDGGIADSIPFEYLAAQGYDKLIVVLTRDLSYRKTPISKPMAKLFYRKYPQFVDALLHRHEVYNAAVSTLQEWEQSSRAFVLRPSQPIKIGRIETDPARLQSVYDLGVQDCKKYIPRLIAYLNT